MTAKVSNAEQTEFNVPTQSPLGPGSAQPVSDPLVLGLPLLSAGAVALGLDLVGYVNVNSEGSLLALILAASGLGLLVATIAGTRLESTPVSSPWIYGRSLPRAVLGVLAAFFISYGLCILGLVHGWFGVSSADIRHTVASFQISWLVVFMFFGLASVRLSALFTVLFASFDLVLLLLLVSTLNQSTTMPTRIAGVLTLIIAAVAGYVSLAVASSASRGKELPIGRPIAQ